MNGNTSASIERIRKSRRTGRCPGTGKPVYRAACWWASVLLAMLPLLLSAGSFAGTIHVSSNADNDVPNGEITLREALLIAKGDRVPFRDDHPDTVDEADHIDGSFGEDIADTINVPVSVGGIVLTSVLPALDDSTDGIWAASELIPEGSVTGAPAFKLSTNDHTIRGFTVWNFGAEGEDGGVGAGSMPAIEITGSGNTIQAMVIEDSVADGIMIAGPDALRRVATGLIEDLRGLGFRDQAENHAALLKAEARAVQSLLDSDDPRPTERGLQALRALESERRKVVELEPAHAKAGTEALVYHELSRLRTQGEQQAEGPSSENVSMALSQLVADLPRRGSSDDPAPSPEVPDADLSNQSTMA